MEIYQGQQIIRYIGGDNTAFADCSQIIAAVYLNDTGERKLVFTKVADDHFHNAGQIEASEADEYGFKFTVTADMSDDLEAGLYYIEVSRAMIANGQIFKSVAEFFTVKKSRTL